MIDRILLALFTAAAYAGLISHRSLNDGVQWDREAPMALGAGRSLLRAWQDARRRGTLHY